MRRFILAALLVSFPALASPFCASVRADRMKEVAETKAATELVFAAALEANAKPSARKELLREKEAMLRRALADIDARYRHTCRTEREPSRPAAVLAAEVR